MLLTSSTLANHLRKPPLLTITSLRIDNVVHYSWIRSWSWSSSCGRQSVDQFVWVLGLHLGPLTRFYFALLLSADNYLILVSKASSLTRKRICSLQCNHSLVPITIFYRLIWDCVPILSPRPTHRDYGGSILTRLHTGRILIISVKCYTVTISVPRVTDLMIRRKSVNIEIIV
jgi:hypothetical protein